MKNADVAIGRGENVIETVRKTLGLLGGLGNLIRRGDTVLINPNYAVPMRSETGVTTNPHVVVGLIEALKDAGAREVIVAESSMVGFDAGEVMPTLGAKQMSKFERKDASTSEWFKRTDKEG